MAAPHADGAARPRMLLSPAPRVARFTPNRHRIRRSRSAAEIARTRKPPADLGSVSQTTRLDAHSMSVAETPPPKPSTLDLDEPLRSMASQGPRAARRARERRLSATVRRRNHATDAKPEVPDVPRPSRWSRRDLDEALRPMASRGGRAARRARERRLSASSPLLQGLASPRWHALGQASQARRRRSARKTRVRRHENR